MLNCHGNNVTIAEKVNGLKNRLIFFMQIYISFPSFDFEVK